MTRDTATVDARRGVDLLPAGATPFAGRRTEQAALATARRSTGVLVVAGRPGSGRTSLAVHFARTIAADFPDGLLHVRLSASDGHRVEPGRAARRLLEQLGEAPDGLLPGPEDPACRALRDTLKGRRVLLVLDDVQDAAQLKPLLPEAPECLVMATTTGPLKGLKSVDPVILGGLEQPAALELLDTLVGGTRLSCDPVGAAELSEACTAKPAALRMMAGWLRANPRAAVTDAVRELASVRRSTPAQPSAEDPKARELLPAEPVPLPESEPLAGAFELIYRALPPGRARMLRTLTLAPAQLADLRTASALVGCPAPEAAAALEQLADQELLDREPTAEDGTARYRVPGRLYARLVELRDSQDRTSEVELARARLLERLVRLVDSARMLLDPATGPDPDPLPGPLRLRTAAQARGWLLSERDLLLGAVERAIGQGGLDGSAGRLITALLRALPLTGAAGPADLYQLHELVFRVAERQGATRRAAAASLNLGDLHVAAGQWEQAVERYRTALDRAREAADEPACARALEGVAQCHRALGDHVRAADEFGRALALRQGLGDQPAEARLLVRVAESLAAQRRFEEAQRQYRAALAVLRRLGNEARAAAVSAALDRVQHQLDGERIRIFRE